MQFTLQQLACFVTAGEAGSNAILANIRKTIVVDIFSRFCRQQTNDEKLPGMASM